MGSEEGAGVVFPKPHALCISFPSQSHIKATLKFAKLLHNRGFHITFVNNEYNHNRFLRTKGPHALDGLPDFRFTSIPDGLPPSDNPDSTQDVPAICNSIRNFMISPFRDLVAKLNDPQHSNGAPPVTCIVTDTMAFAVDVAREFGIPSVAYWSFAACGFMGFKQFKPLLDQGITPFKDDSYLTNGYLETPFEVPGMKDIRLRDLPSFFRTTDPDDQVFYCLMEVAEAAHRASAVLLHTFDALEPNVLTALNEIYPNRVYPVAPMQLILNQIKSTQQESSLDTISYSLWKEEPECLRWLDTKPPNSVIYVNFGSITTMSKQHLIEFGMGFANSDVSFLWVIRPDLVTGESAAFPPEFKEKADKTGFISGWCPQEDVLNHPAVGGFLTHCGWGSIIESLTAGVPLLCWPFFGDQPINCRTACTEWGIGMEIDKDVKRNDVEELVRELMNGDKGKKMRSKAQDWAKLAREATSPGGSSVLNLDRLVSQVLSPNSK
uniref:Glycosyltransferase n=1 Tax=Linum usitatissimum TaxID=4006 RepID=G9BER4_LINUS|nr:glucosyltransferase [Linum usitatissimum]